MDRTPPYRRRIDAIKDRLASTFLRPASVKLVDGFVLGADGTLRDAKGDAAAS